MHRNTIRNCSAESQTREWGLMCVWVCVCACVCSYVRCYYPSLQYLHHLSATRRLRKKGSWKTQALETKWRTNEKKPQVVYSAGCTHALMPAHKHLSSVVWNYNYSKEMWTSQRLIKQSVGDAARLGCVLTQACYATNPLQDAAECPTQKTPDNRLLLFFSLIAGRGSFWVALSLWVRGHQRDNNEIKLIWYILSE